MNEATNGEKQMDTSDMRAKMEGSCERFTFAWLHGVPQQERTPFLSALAGCLARELTQEEAITFTSALHRYY
jgi:hypothetical protein